MPFVIFFRVSLLRGETALVGEIAVPCYLQPATAGMNSGSPDLLCIVSPW